jgi:hypothetical protein
VDAVATAITVGQRPVSMQMSAVARKPAEFYGIELAFLSASLTASPSSTDLMTLAQGSAQASDMALSCLPTRPSQASSRNSPGMQEERAAVRCCSISVRFAESLHRHG